MTKKATCTSDGVKSYICSCGKKYKETIKALGHNYQWTITKQASNTVAESVDDFGIRDLKCENCKDVKQTQNMINMGTRTIYGHFDVTSANAFRDRINKYRSEFFGNSEQNLYELKECADLVSLVKFETVKYTLMRERSGIWGERADVIEAYSDENLDYVWRMRFISKGFISYMCTTQIGTCCFHYDSNADGKTDEVFWSFVLDRIE